MASASNWQADELGELPEWFMCEAYRPAPDGDWRFRTGLRCRDGDLVTLDIEVVQISSPGTLMRLNTSRRAVLEAIQQQVVVELAKLSLEDR